MHDARHADAPSIDPGHPALGSLIDAGYPVQRIVQAMACYDEPQRRYHDREHLREIFDIAHDLALPLSPAQSLALLYHDAVYVPGAVRGVNELLSAQLLRVQGAGMPAALIELACSMIVDTGEHLATSDQARLVIDLDLIRLGGPEDRFDFFSRQVFAEQRALFGDADDDLAWRRFQQRRAPFFRRLLERAAIFSTPPLHQQFEQPARRNLMQALAAAQSAP